MITVKKGFFGLLLIAFVVQFSCKDEGEPGVYSQIPDRPVNITINTDLPLYFHLKNMGNFVYEDAGHRGVIVVHAFDDNFYAFERTCTYLPDKECSRIFVDSTLIDFRCGGYNDTAWISCCSSRYSFQGIPIQGPSTFPLKQYQVTRDGSLLFIRN